MPALPGSSRPVSSSRTGSSGSKGGSSIQVAIIILVLIVLTMVCCATCYIYRLVTTRDKTYNDIVGVVKSATEVVTSITDRGLPAIRTKLDELDSRGRTIENVQRATKAAIERISTTGPSDQPRSEAEKKTISGDMNAEAEKLLAARRSK